jgi:hypothetical protein
MKAIRCGWQNGSQIPPWLVISPISGALLALLNIMALEGFGLPTWLTSLYPAAAAAPFAIVAGAVAGAAIVVGGVIAFCVWHHFGRLKTLQDSVCISGVADAANDSEDHWYLSIAWDPDRSIDVVLHTSQLNLITDKADFIRCNDAGTPLLHIEIASHVPDAACIGGVIGSIVGSVLGIVAGIAAGAAIASLGCGPFALFCFLLALLVAFLVAAAITAAGAWVGGIVGGLVGKALDKGDHLLELGASVGPGTCLTANGRWITDLGHGWNEVHPVVTLKLSGQHPKPRPSSGYLQSDADICPDDCPVAPPPPPPPPKVR